jgi:hypothetical protein
MPIGVLKGHAKPGGALARQIGVLYGEQKVVEVQKMMDDYVGVDALAALITEGINTVTTKDGRLESLDLAAFIWKRMMENQKHGPR